MVRTSIRAATRPPLLGAAPAILHKIPAHVLTLLDIVADLSTGGVATLVASASVEVCLLDGERDTTREIGSMGLLSSGQPQKSTAGRLGPRGRKILALIPALVLVTGVFVFFGREARAQQLELQHTATSFSIAVEQTTGATLFETSRTEKPPVETSPAETPPADRSEPPALEPWPVDRQDSESPDAAETTLRIRDSSSGWAPPEKPGLGPKPDLAPPVALTPEPVESELSALESVPETLSLEEGHPPSWLAEVVPVPEPGVPEAQAPLSSSPEDSDDGVAETLENTVLGASRTFVEGPTLPPIVEMENNGLLDAALASLLSDGEVNRAPAAERSEDPASPSAGSTGPENPSDGAPQPASPIAPLLGGSSFSSSGGQAGLGGGGFAPLLLICVLASGLVLLRRDGLLHRTSCEPPKPSSALLAPLERPG